MLEADRNVREVVTVTVGAEDRDELSVRVGRLPESESDGEVEEAELAVRVTLAELVGDAEREGLVLDV